MLINKDYDDFVKRMGSFDQELEINYKNFVKRTGSFNQEHEKNHEDDKIQDGAQEILKTIGDCRIK